MFRAAIVFVSDSTAQWIEGEGEQARRRGPALKVLFSAFAFQESV
jgi:hypothetical protein